MTQPKPMGLAASDPETVARVTKLGGAASQNRPFKDPAAASRAAKKRWALTRAKMHGNDKEMGGPDKGKAGTAPSPNDAEEASRDGQ